MKQIPFDLQRALAGDKVVTRDGQEVFGITKNPKKDGRFPLFGLIEGDSVNQWFIDGRNVYDRDSDLFMKPEPTKTVKRWVNFYPSGHASVFYDEEEAKLRSTPSAIAIAVPVEFEEGFGVNHE